MEYVYAALLLHNAKQPISEASVTKVLTAAGVSADVAKAKALVSALDGVNIEEAVKAAMAPVAVAAPAGGAAPAAAKEEKKDEKSDAEKEAEAAAGLSALFG